MNLIKRTCLYCNKEFYIEESKHLSALKRKDRKNSAIYCSLKCVGLFNKKKKKIKCLHCQTLFEQKQINQKFCKQSCSATYNNLHKKKGTRVSKLEIYLQEKLVKLYPSIKFLFNDR